ncbi:MAG: hypothetical protein H7061_11320 [Bdellovibrionaceae bacterium]|nr:hypothetical protein [Bdellovibrio sp.]
MKQIFLAIFTLVSLNLSHAQTLPADLKETMKAIGADMKKLMAQSSNAAANADSATISQDLVRLATHAKQFLPDTIKSLSGDKRGAAETDYRQQLSQVVQMGSDLNLAFSSNDNGKAAMILKQLNQSKREGHSAYKEN